MAHGIQGNPHITKEKPYAWVIIFVAALYYFYQFILRVSPSVMTEDLMRDFGVAGCSLGILSACYYNAYSAMQIPLGMMMDRFGPRRLMTASCCIAAIGTLIFSFAESLYLAGFGRLLIGMGAACGFIGCMKLATIWFPLHRMGRVIGIVMLLGTLGAKFGGAPLRGLIDTHGWRFTLMCIACIGISLAFLLYVVLRDSSKDAAHPRLPQPTRKDFFQGLYKVITSRKAWMIGLYGSLMHVPIAAVADLWGNPYLTTTYGIDTKEAGSIISFIYIGVAVGAPFATLYSEYIKKRKTPMVLSAITSVIVYGVMFYGGHIPLEWMYALMFLGGFCFTGQCLVFAAVCEIMPLWASGVAVGFTNMVVMMSGVVFEPFVGYILDWQWDGTLVNGARHFTTENFYWAMLPIPISLFLSLLCLKFIPETYGHGEHLPHKKPNFSPKKLATNESSLS